MSDRWVRIDVTLHEGDVDAEVHEFGELELTRDPEHDAEAAHDLYLKVAMRAVMAIMAVVAAKRSDA